MKGFGLLIFAAFFTCTLTINRFDKVTLGMNKIVKTVDITTNTAEGHQQLLIKASIK